MAGLRDLINGGKDNDLEAQKVAKVLAKDYPLVAEILGGLSEKGDSPKVSPSAITIFIHEGKARFSTNVKSAERTLIGEIEDLENPWGSINTALLTGGVSSKRYTARVNGMTPEQEKAIVY